MLRKRNVHVNFSLLSCCFLRISKLIMFSMSRRPFTLNLILVLQRPTPSLGAHTLTPPKALLHPITPIPHPQHTRARPRAHTHTLTYARARTDAHTYTHTHLHLCFQDIETEDISLGKEILAGGISPLVVYPEKSTCLRGMVHP